MVKNLIKVLLSRFQTTDTKKDSIGCLKIHVVIWYIYFLIVELAFTSIFLTVYAFTVREFSWSSLLSVSILLILFFTLFIGVYAIYSEKTSFFRWFSLRTKLVYYLMFIWALAIYFSNPNWTSFFFAFGWTLGATVYVFEDYAIIRTMDFVRYRYRGLNDKNDV